MGWLVGIEPTNAGATIQCVNRFTTATVNKQQKEMVTLAGLEPATLWFVVKYSNPTELQSHIKNEQISNELALTSKSGGPIWTWTKDRPVMSRLLYQLSYRPGIYGAENEARTRDPHLGKVVLYHWAISADPCPGALFPSDIYVLYRFSCFLSTGICNKNAVGQFCQTAFF